jgi:acyl-coenzyme A synthetase/AMP-(fatty) acid ligase
MPERAAILNVDLGHPDPDTIFGILASHRVTSFCAPPTLYRRLVQADCSKYDLSALRHCTSAGEPLNPEVIRAWKNGTGGLEIYDGYGQTETTCTPSVCSPATTRIRWQPPMRSAARSTSPVTGPRRTRTAIFGCGRGTKTISGKIRRSELRDWLRSG